MKIIKRSWLPVKLPELAVWFGNFAAVFEDVRTALGFTAAEAAAIDQDNQTVQWLAASDEAYKALGASFRGFRDETLFGEKNDPTPDVPSDALPPPPAAVSTMIIERLINLVDRIELAPNYTAGVGAQLGIVKTDAGENGGSGAPSQTLKPQIRSVSPFADGYRFSIAVNRMGMDAFKVQIRRMDSENWTDAAFGTASPMEVKITPTGAPGQPERFQVRVVLVNKNETVGEPSDPVYVTVNP